MPRFLILAPHADDETMGCGGLIAKYPGEVVIAVVAVMSQERRVENECAMVQLGDPECEYGDFPDGMVDSHQLRLQKWVDDLVERFSPETLLVPFPSPHQDHQAVYQAGIRGARISMHERHVPHRTLVYDVGAYDIQPWAVPFQWNVFETLTEHQAAAKAAAMGCYTTQVVQSAHVTSELLATARVAGAARGVEYAEPYALVRELR